MRRGLKLALAMCCLPLFQAVLSANTCVTCYIDYENGNDAWDGTTKTFTGGTTGPWKHAPGMLGLSPSNTSTGDACASKCASQSPVPGDKYILKGGVIWPYTALPWVFSWGGSATSGTYGCAGAGCIYIGYDPTWNKGIVNAITLNRDLGGCTSVPSLTISGGGGSNAAAAAVVMPSGVNSVEPNAYGFVTSLTITNQGSGYTSSPAVLVTGGGCMNVQAVADIYRPIIDAGLASNITWEVGYGPGNTSYGPGLILMQGYVIADHLELRNILQSARNCGTNCNNNPDGYITAFMMDRSSSGHITFSNNYIHGRKTSCIFRCASQESGDQAINLGNDANDEAAFNYITNGDQLFVGTNSTDCAVSAPCEFGEFSIAAVGNIHHNHSYLTRWMIHAGGSPSNPLLIDNNEMWLSVYDVGTGHVNELYVLLTAGILYEYNNIFHNCVSGASNQQQMGNGTTQYFFNNVSWGLGGGTPNYGIDPSFNAGPNGGTFFFYNNTMQADYSTAPCLNSGTGSYNAALLVVMQNNHCLSNESLFWQNNATGSSWQNQAHSTTPANVQAANQTDTYSSIAYSVANLFAPIAASGDTVTFTSSTGTANLTILCSGNLAALCLDINGNPRPTLGGWQAGAYMFTGIAPPSPPTGLTAIAR